MQRQIHLLSEEKVEVLFSRFAKQNPQPTTELKYTTPFELFVAVVLSAQATDKKVNEVTGRLFKIANTPEAFLELGEARLSELIYPLSFYRTKAKNLIAACKIIVEEYQGNLPTARDELLKLPGVGRKTANVLANTLYEEEVYGVDTHVFRVSNRTGLAPGKTPEAVEKLLQTRVPMPYRRHAHHWLVLHGRYTCTARKPKCQLCMINDLCEYPTKH